MSEGYAFTVNGFPVTAFYRAETVERVFIPLLRAFASIPREDNRRAVILLAAPPAAGKSTLAAMLEHLSRVTPGVSPIQALGLDGFHYHQAYIDAHTVPRGDQIIPMRAVKGAPESFDTDKLRAALIRARAGENLRWPYYDRRLHDVVEEAIPVTGDILLIEGNWMLLNEPDWTLPCDYTVMIRAEGPLIRRRLIERKMRGGATREEARAWLEQNDWPNVERCLSDSREADLTLRMTEAGDYIALKPLS